MTLQPKSTTRNTRRFLEKFRLYPDGTKVLGQSNLADPTGRCPNGAKTIRTSYDRTRLLPTAPVMPRWQSDIPFARPATPETSKHPKADTGSFAFPKMLLPGTPYRRGIEEIIGFQPRLAQQIFGPVAQPPRSQLSIGTPKPILGRSISSRGTFL